VLEGLLQALGGFVSGRWTQRLSRRKTEQSEAPWRSRATAYHELIVPSSVDEVEARCRRVLGSLGAERQAAAVGAIEVVTSASWRSSGTVIRVQLTPAEGGTRMDLAAWPGAQLFDWGESRRALRKVIDAFDDAHHTGPAIYRR
jgi:hypothetical protein